MRSSRPRRIDAQRHVHQRRAGAVLSRIAGGDRVSGRAGPDGRAFVDAESDRDSASWPRCWASASTKSFASASGWAAAFGGKESQAAIPAMMAALVAHKTGRAARVDLQQRRRHARDRQAARVLSEWEVGFGDDGRIQACAWQFYSERRRLDRSFARRDGTHAAAHRQLLLPAARRAYRPGVLHQFPSNTAFRGFGGPQGMAAIENVIQEIADI